MKGSKGSKVKKCVGKEGFQRMNYLYQLSNSQLLTQQDCVVSSFYTNLMTTISRRTVQKLEPEIKRTLCKGCRGILVSGITCKVRIKKKHIHWHCLTCHTIKKFKADPNYKLWLEQPGAVVEVLNYNMHK